MKVSIVIIFSFWSSLLVAAPTVVLKTVGRVGNEIITSRAVQMNSAAEQAIFKTKGKIEIPKIGTVAFKKEVTAMLLETTVYLESKAFKLSQVSNAEILKATKDAEKRLKKVPTWNALEVTPTEFKKVVARKLRAKKFIRFKADSSVVAVTNSEAKEYFDNNRLKFGDLPFDNFKENIKAYLSRQQVEQRLRDWFEVLQNKYKVKNSLSEI